MIKVIVLICSLASVPNSKDCNGVNAIDMVEAPPATDSRSCVFGAMTYVAGRPNSYPDDYYLKVLCQSGPKSPIG
ncbi:hypothetical protein [Tistlia consotensis]|uniref:hypothetical protein n=1 Tax=Tistlia consotensis TaxID=1321365 RepID=UPI000A1661F8|nr:hypothetical protein [Tistlia consotensis]